MNILIVVHIKSSYDSWKVVFDMDPGGRVEFADESRTRVGRVDDQTAVVQLFEVDMESLAYEINDPESPSVDPLIAEHVVKHEVYSLTSIVPPA